MLAVIVIVLVILSVLSFLFVSTFLIRNHNEWQTYGPEKYISIRLNLTRNEVLYSFFNSTQVELVNHIAVSLANESNIATYAIIPAPSNSISSGWVHYSIGGVGSLYTNLTGEFYLVCFTKYLPNFTYRVLTSLSLDSYFGYLGFYSVILLVPIGVAFLASLVRFDK